MISPTWARRLTYIIGFLVFAVTAFVIKTHIQPFNITSVLRSDDPILVKYKKHLESYNDEADLYVLLEDSEDLFSGTRLHDLILNAGTLYKTIPGLKEVKSIYEQDYPVLENNKLKLRTFFENGLLTPAGKKHLLETPVFKFSYLDPTGHAAMIFLRLRENLSPIEVSQLMENVLTANSVLAAKFPGVKAHFLGTEVARHYFMKEISKTQGRILPLVIFVILGLLYYLFRSWVICALSLFVMLLGYAATVALVVVTEKTINPFSSFALLFVLIIATADLVHLFSAIAATSHENLKERILAAKAHIYRPCFICAVTTWIGLLSLVLADLPPIINFGIYCAFGVALCFFLIFHLLPYLLQVFAVKIPKKPSQFDVQAFSKIPFLLKYRYAIIFSFAAVMLTLGFYSTKLKAGDNLYRKFVATHPLSQAVEKFNHYFHFTGSIDVTFDADREYFSSPQGERLFATLYREIAGTYNVAHIKSLHDYLGLLKGIKNDPKADFSNDRQLRSWYELFDENQVFEGFLPFRKNQSRMTIFMKSMESEDLLKTQAAVEEILRKPEYAGIVHGEVNGFSTVRSAIFHSIYGGFVKSFLLDFFGIFLCFVIFFRSLKWSLIAMIPNLLPVIAISGTMGILEMTVEYNLIVLVAIVFGIAVDDTTHFIYYLRQSYDKGRDIVEATKFALKNTSVALLGTTFIFCVTVPTFFLTDILMFSQVAFIIILAMALGVCGDMFVLPAILFALKGKQIKKNIRGYNEQGADISELLKRASPANIDI